MVLNRAVPVNTISAERLDLIPMTPEFLEASLEGNQSLAEQLLGLKIPPDWFEEQGLMKIRLDQLRRNPALQPWLLRAAGLRQQQVMAGHIGFHSQPGPGYLEKIAPGGIEFGYTIFPPFRRQGYAREACIALMNWAQQEHGVQRFVVTISPENLPSLRLAAQLGFQRIGEHVDEEDGLEYIFERKPGPWKTRNRQTILDQSPWLVVEHHTVELPDGRLIPDWPWVIMPDFINVVAETEVGAFLCLRQSKYGLNGPTLALVGGYLSPGEDPLAAAQRELREETGYEAGEWIELGHFRVDPNRGIATGHLYLARQARRVAEPDADDLEDLQLIHLTRSALEEALDGGEFQLLSWAAAVSLALRRLD